MHTVSRNVTSLNQIVEDVLDVSRIISGKLRLDVQRVDLGPVIQNALETVRPAADAKGIQLITIADPRTPAVSGDPERLQQILWNVLSNAVKFTKRDGKVELRLEQVNSHIEITVSDTGAGISPEFLPHVFGRFRQADAGMDRAAGGLGLGLAITRHLVELQGGRIYAASEGHHSDLPAPRGCVEGERQRVFTICVTSRHGRRRRFQRDGCAAGPLGMAPAAEDRREGLLVTGLHGQYPRPRVLERDEPRATYAAAVLFL